MEPIKITDKLTLRREALRMAIKLDPRNIGVEHQISVAQKIVDYIQGDAELPEYEDTHKDFKEMLGKMQESFNPTPRSEWISADSEMKPAKAPTMVLVMCKDYNSPLLGEFLGKDNWDVFDADVTKNTLRGEIEVVAWTPIPLFTEPIKL